MKGYRFAHDTEVKNCKITAFYFAAGGLYIAYIFDNLFTMRSKALISDYSASASGRLQDANNPARLSSNKAITAQHIWGQIRKPSKQ